MRTSLNDIQQAEAYLLHTSLPADRLVFEARMLISPLLAQQVACQQQVNELVHAYGQKQLKAEIEAIHNRLFTSPAHKTFRQKIRSIFRG